ncbi:hypothetical protein HJ590_13215 [Naumannella sp. ID2617S]|nr:hypothetical protein [Naumannella sp. ID2617S]
MICEQCGATFQGKRSTARFCSTRCRVAWNRAKKAGEPSARPALTVVPPPGAEKRARAKQKDVSIEESTRTTLEAAGRHLMPEGRVALMLARRLDGQQNETGTSLAVLSKALTAALDRALANVAPEKDAVDELRELRDRIAAG